MQDQAFGGCEDGLVIDSALLPGSEDIPLLAGSSQFCASHRSSVCKLGHTDVLLCYQSETANILTADSHRHTPFHPTWLPLSITTHLQPSVIPIPSPVPPPHATDCHMVSTLDRNRETAPRPARSPPSPRDVTRLGTILSHVPRPTTLLAPVPPLLSSLGTPHSCPWAVHPCGQHPSATNPNEACKGLWAPGDLLAIRYPCINTTTMLSTNLEKGGWRSRRDMESETSIPAPSSSDF